MSLIPRVNTVLTRLLGPTSFLPVLEKIGGKETGKYLIDQQPLICKYDGRGVVRLAETNTRSGVSEVYIDGLDANAVILKLDVFGVKYFKDETYNKACDYLVLTTYNGDDYALLVDLKSDIVVEDNPPDNRLSCVFQGNAKIAWQMAGGVYLTHSLLCWAQKLGEIGRFSRLKYRYAVLTKVYIPPPRETTTGVPMQTAVIAPPPESIVARDHLIWQECEDGDKIHINLLIN